MIHLNVLVYHIYAHTGCVPFLGDTPWWQWLLHTNAASCYIKLGDTAVVFPCSISQNAFHTEGFGLRWLRRPQPFTMMDYITPRADDITSSPCRFSDLFALAEEYEDSQSKPLKSRRKAPATSPRSRKGVAPPTNNEEESASSSASVRS